MCVSVEQAKQLRSLPGKKPLNTSKKAPKKPHPTDKDPNGQKGQKGRPTDKICVRWSFIVRWVCPLGLSVGAFLSVFCPLGGFFAAFIAVRDHQKSPGFFPGDLVPLGPHEFPVELGRTAASKKPVGRSEKSPLLGGGKIEVADWLKG